VKGLLLIAAPVALAACTTAAPPYQAAGGVNSVGHFAAPAADGRHMVGYTGSKEMSAAQVAEYAMLRAAELAIANGQQWFAVIASTSRKVRTGDVNDFQGRTGSFLSTGSIGADAGSGSDRSNAPPGISDGSVPTGPSTAGGDVPYQVVERWIPPTVFQTTLVVQLGSGGSASFAGLEKAPEIFSAKEVADRIRAKMAK
jgi:hypothetical protein